MELKRSPFPVCSFLCALGLCFAQMLNAQSASNACSLLTQSQVAGSVGSSIVIVQQISANLCQWSAPNQPNSMNAKKVTLTISEAQAFGFAKTPIVSSIKTFPAPGICDDAIYTVSPGVTPGLGTSLYFKKGTSYFVLHVYGFPDQSTAMGMEKALAIEVCANV